MMINTKDALACVKNVNIEVSVSPLRPTVQYGKPPVGVYVYLYNVQVPAIWSSRQPGMGVFREIETC